MNSMSIDTPEDQRGEPVSERSRCIALLQRHASVFENRKLFHISRALLRVAEELTFSDKRTA